MSNNENNQQKKFKKPSIKQFNIFWVWGLIAVVLVGWNLFGVGDSAQETQWSAVKTMIEQGDVKKIEIVNKSLAEIYLKDESIETYKAEDEALPAHGVQYTYNIPSVDIFYQELASIELTDGIVVDVSYVERRSIWREAIGFLLPIVVLVFVWMFIMRSMNKGGGGGNGVFNVGKSKAQLFDKDGSIKTTFKDVAGLEQEKIEVMEIVDFMKNPQKYTELGCKIPRGALLVGPPGTGKTLLAKAVAGEANVPFFSISGSDFVEMFVGVGASRVRDLFKQAKEKAPCIVFIDEIDAIGRARGKNAGYSSNDERENTLNQLLTEMDGFGTNDGVIILAATNRADILDKALLRAGRFDRQIEVSLPDLNERKEIFDIHLAKLKLADGLNKELLAKKTPGFSGADIANVCNEAALIAARNDKKAVEQVDFSSAVDRIIGGLERRNKIITKSEKKTIAYHEAGHATVSWLLEEAHPLVQVTIVPRGKSLGAAWYMPEERQITTTEQMMDEMASILGGRAAEELIFGKISTGALSDLERITKMAYAMVVYYGMSEKIGNVSFYDSSGRSDMGLTKPYSEDTARSIDEETKLIIDKAYVMASNVLKDNIDGFRKLAELLLEKEVAVADDLVAIFGKRKKDIARELEEQEEQELEKQRKLAEEALKEESAESNQDAVEEPKGEIVEEEEIGSEDSVKAK